MVTENKVLVSILIPTYNRAAIVSETLDSVVGQKHRPLEIIVVDDGSTDGTAELLTKFTEESSNEGLLIRVLSQPNRGAPAARNLAISNATGKYLQFLDSDDTLSPEKISSQVSALEKNQKEIAVCDFRSIDVTSGESWVTKNDGNAMVNVCLGRSPHTMTPLIRSDLIKNKIFWLESMKKQQDLDFMLKVFLSATGYVYTPGVWCNYRYHDGSQISVSGRTKWPPFFIRAKSATLFCFSVHNKNRLRVRSLLFYFLAIGSIVYHATRYAISKAIDFCKVSAKQSVSRSRCKNEQKG